MVRRLICSSLSGVCVAVVNVSRSVPGARLAIHLWQRIRTKQQWTRITMMGPLQAHKWRCAVQPATGASMRRRLPHKHLRLRPPRGSMGKRSHRQRQRHHLTHDGCLVAGPRLASQVRVAAQVNPRMGPISPYPQRRRHCSSARATSMDLFMFRSDSPAWLFRCFNTVLHCPAPLYLSVPLWRGDARE